MTKKSKVMIIDFTIKDNKEKSQSKYTLLIHFAAK